MNLNWNKDLDRMRSYQWKQSILNHITMNYLRSAGSSVDTNSLTGKIQQAMELANKLHPLLDDSDNYMYFHMQQLCLIELICQNDLDMIPSTSSQSDGNINLDVNIEPNLRFLIKLILWAERHMNDVVPTDDFEEEFIKRASQGF